MLRSRGAVTLSVVVVLALNGLAWAQGGRRPPAAASTAVGRAQAVVQAEAALNQAERSALPADIVTAARAYVNACVVAWAETAIQAERCRLRLGEALLENEDNADAQKLLSGLIDRFARAGAPELQNLARARSAVSDVLPNRPENSEALNALNAALEFQEHAFGDAHLDTIRTLRRLGSRYIENARYADAAAVLARARAALNSANAPLLERARLTAYEGRNAYEAGQLDEAERKLREALALLDACLGPYDYRRVVALSTLVRVLTQRGRTEDAEAAGRRMLELDERAFGPLDARLSSSLNNIAGALPPERAQEAELLLQRALDLTMRDQGPGSWRTAQRMHNLAAVKASLGQRDAADQLYRRAIEIVSADLGVNHPSVAYSLNSLAALRRETGDFAEAEALTRRALAIRTAALGEAHPLTIASRHELGRIHATQTDWAALEAVSRQSAKIATAALGVNSRDAGLAQASLSRALLAQGRSEQAWMSARAAMPGLRQNVGSASIMSAPNLREAYEQVVQSAALASPVADRFALGFEAMQRIMGSPASAAAIRASARLGADDPKLSQLLQRQLSFAARIESLERQAADAYGRADEARIHSATGELMAERERLAETLRNLAGSYPRFAELSGQSVVAPEDLRGGPDSVLRRGEGLMQILQTPNRFYAVLLTPGAMRLQALDLSAAQSEALVARIRKSIRLEGVISPADLPEFDIDAAHQLYERIVGPFRGDLRGVETLYVIPDGPLASIPLSLLVVEPAPTQLALFERYRRARFLGDEIALATLPSPAALVAARRYARASRAREALIAFADPALAGTEDVRTLAQWARLRSGISAPTAGARNAASVCRLRPLPDSRREALALAQRLGSREGDVRLGRDASEHALFDLNASGDLARRRIILFATHGLVAGELTGVVEPALVLTPPEGCAAVAESDDGVVTASEIATLTFDAEWVILSGCNTAAADGRPGAAPLSGLARAFLYAGARRLLVSHWSVDSQAAGDLTSALFDPRNRNLTPAAALREAMRAMRESRGAQSYRSHPAFWASFVLVGDGR